MKSIKFLPFLMALFLGAAFCFSSCDRNDDDDDSSSVTETMKKGESFYDDCKSYKENKDATKLLSIVANATEYTQHKDDKTWVTEFIAGMVMAKYNVSDKVAQTEEYLSKASSVKTVLDGGITTTNVLTALTTISEFIDSKN